jgi:hypothetical protein
LTLFCEALVANPWLRRDPTWLDFMSSPAPPSVPKKNSDGVKVPSEQILQNILDRLPLPSNPLERTYEIKDELVSVEKQCTHLTSSSSQLFPSLSVSLSLSAPLCLSLSHVSLACIPSTSASRS